MALTAAQLADFQKDLAIDASQAVFTNDELNRLFERAGDDYNTAVYMAWRQIAAGATRWVDYKVAQTSINLSQARAHIKDMLTFWQGESKTPANQVMLLGLNQIPTQHKRLPGDVYSNEDPRVDRYRRRRT